jgi:SAM-dependent methyltransferase
VYDEPELYDLAFSYRDYAAEVAGLIDLHRRHQASIAGSAVGATPGLRILELAAGPSRHCLAALDAPALAGSLGAVSTVALDASPAMVAYGSRLAKGHGSAFEYLKGDMAAFALPRHVEQVDTAWCLLGSLGHLLTTARLRGFLASAAGSLRPGGTLVLELPHPRETFRLDHVTTDG